MRTDPPTAGEPSPPPPTVQPAAHPLPAAEVAQRRAHRRQRDEQVCQRAQQGWTFQAIVQEVGLHRKTVAQYVRADRFPDRARPPSVLDPYKPYLLTRWNQGCRTGMRLYEELQRQGYRGGRSTVLGSFTRLRKAQGLAPRIRTGLPLPPVTDPTIQGCTPRQAPWVTLRHPTDVTAGEQDLLARVQQAHPACAQAIALAQDFAQLLRARQPERLDTWLHHAATSTLAAFQRLAQSFQRDYAAIKAGVTLPWSSGPVEGHINRLKMLKRQMFGRAHRDLLGRRFVGMPRPQRAPVARPRAPAHTPRKAA